MAKNIVFALIVILYLNAAEANKKVIETFKVYPMFQTGILK